VSIRTRLTLWYTSVLGAILLLFSFAVFLILLYGLLDGVDRPLRDTAKKIVDQSRAFPGDITQVQIPPLDMFQSPGVSVIQVWTPQGELSQQSGGNLAEPLDPEALNTAQPVIHDVTVRGVHLRVLTYPLIIEDSNQLVGYLQIASPPLGWVDQARRDLLVILVSGIVLALVLSALVGVMLARRALKPIDTVIATALNISRADDLERRITYAGPPDEIGRLVAAFNEMLERLDKLFRAQQRFLADISHELRTPLTTIRGNVDLIRRFGADPDSLDAIQGEAERMTRMVGDLLLLAKAEAGGLPLAYEPVELDTLLLEVYRQARVLGNGLDIKIGEEDQVTVLGDADKLRQLLLNLVDNAIQYTPKGGQVTLGLAREDGWARLTVADTGIGIPPEDLPHIFERFYRVDKARSRSGASAGGAGLGLSIASWIAQAHGGHITVASEPGRGATFTVWLPVVSNRVLNGLSNDAKEIGEAPPARVGAKAEAHPLES
jgi:signal transduction histidine kinase